MNGVAKFLPIRAWRLAVAVMVTTGCFAAGAKAAESHLSVNMFDPNPRAAFFPITANPDEARQFAFSAHGLSRIQISFSSRAPQLGDSGFSQVARQTAPAVPAAKAKRKNMLPVGCEPLGSIKSPLGSLAGRCIASL